MLTAVVSTTVESTLIEVESTTAFEVASLVPVVQLTANIVAIAIAKIAFFIGVCFFVKLLYHI